MGGRDYRYDVLHPLTGKPAKMPLGGWSCIRSTMDRYLADGRVLFGADESSVPRYKRYLDDADSAALKSVITAGATARRMSLPDEDV